MIKVLIVIGTRPELIKLFPVYRVLKSKKKWCCEFGAWDGIHGSNTFNLVKNYDYNAVYIEGDIKKYHDLVNTSKKFRRIIPLGNHCHFIFLYS